MAEPRETESEQVEFENFFWDSNDLFCVANTDAQFVRVNKAFSHTLGYSIESLEGLSFLKLVHPDDLAETRQEVARLKRGEDTVNFENRYLARDGSWKWLAWTCPAPLPKSRLLYAIARDITLQKQTDEALQVRNSAFAAMHQSLLITDARASDNPIVYANSAFEFLSGYPKSTIMKNNCRFLQNEDHDQKPMETLRAAVSEGTACRVLLRNYRKDTTMFWNELTISPVHDNTGTLTHFVGVQNDVTDLVRSSTKRSKDLASQIETLAPRQKQVLDGLVSGRSIKQVAMDLGISPKTAEMHRTKLLQKMDVGDTVDLVRTVLSSTPPGYYYY